MKNALYKPHCHRHCQIKFPTPQCLYTGCKIDTEKPFSKQNSVYLDKQDFILDELKSSDVPLPKVITTEFSSSERYVQYMKKCSL